MQKLTVSRDELRKRFWSEVHPKIREMAENEQLEMLKMVNTGAFKDRSDRLPNEVMTRWKRLGDEVTDLVKTELYELSYMYYSSPTKFSLLYLASTAKHWAVVKQKRLKSEGGFSDYDIQADLELTAKNLEQFESSILKLEKEYLRAYEQKRFGDASALLTAIEISRKTESIELRNEVNNWRFELACTMGNPDMFFEAWQKILPEAMLDQTILNLLLEKLLYSGLIKGVNVQLSHEGLRAAMRSTSSQQFYNDQAAVYLRSAITGLADDLAAGKCKTSVEFRDLIKESFERSRSSSLAVNPYLATLDVAWK